MPLGGRNATSSVYGRVWDYVYDVPLLSSLHQHLSDPFILDEVQFAY